MKYQFLVLFFLILQFSSYCARRQVHVVYLGEHIGEKTAHEIEISHHAYLHSVKKSEEDARASLVHSYKNVINGFSALLTAEEADKLSKMDGVVSVAKSDPEEYHLHTTRSWDFMNLLEGKGDVYFGINNTEKLLKKSNQGQNVIVGLLDSGVWPESQSFSDEAMGPIPEKWRGVCESGVGFNTSHCNRKLIGARYYLKAFEAYYGSLNETQDYRSPRDKNGHGTHTSSTLGGRRVSNVSAFGGFANGTASGGVPLVRLAMYKVCWTTPAGGNTCFNADILAAFDDAIADGVDVLSVSLGSSYSKDYRNDVIAIGSFHAFKRGIVVVCSAGNSGPYASSVTNVAPWIITVGASSIDRAFPASIALENGTKLQGQTLSPYSLKQMHPLVYAGDVEVPGERNSYTNGYCLEGTLSKTLVEGTIVLCESGYSSGLEKGLEVKRAGGVGIVIANPSRYGMSLLLDANVLPAIVLSWNESEIMYDYMKTNKNPMATMINPATTVLNSKPAPFIAAFSSKGPNYIEPNILKPDITAPGLNILAAWSEDTSLSQTERAVKYNIISGTSMSCPHVAAAVALLKSIHPDWSNSAIRSALMTTAGINNSSGSPITDSFGDPAGPFEYGSGHLQQVQALDPGLVYDATYNDYLLFLCNTNDTALDSANFMCPDNYPSQSNLNYPSLTISRLNGTVNVTRTVTNVLSSNITCVYNVTVSAPQGYSVEIFPEVLRFDVYGEKKSFDVVIKAENASAIGYGYSFGWFLWSDGVHRVRSPIVVRSSYY